MSLAKNTSSKLMKTETAELAPELPSKPNQTSLVKFTSLQILMT